MSYKFQHPEVWQPAEGVSDPSAKRGHWQCTLCSSTWMDIHGALRHENGARHKLLRASQDRQFEQPQMDAPPASEPGSSRHVSDSEPLPRRVQAHSRVLGALAQTLQDLGYRQDDENQDVDFERRESANEVYADDFPFDEDDFLPTHEHSTSNDSSTFPSINVEELEGELDLPLTEEMSIHVARTMSEWLERSLSLDAEAYSDEEIVEQSSSEGTDGSDDEVAGSATVPPTRPQQRWSAVELLSENREWFPWPDKIACILDILHHIPRSMFNEHQMGLIGWSHQVMGIPTPSRRSVKRVEQFLQKLCGIRSIRYQGAFGNVYYVNDMHKIIAQEFANPLVRKNLSDLPEERTKGLSEARHFSRWRHELDGDLTTPMVRVGKHDFYIFEPTLVLDQGSEVYRMPSRWFKRDGEIYADTWGLTFLDSRGWLVEEYDSKPVPLKQFLVSFPFLQESWVERRIPDPGVILGRRDVPNGPTLQWTRTDAKTGNRWRAKAKGKRVFAFPMWLYCDDTSGNKSKKWNKHNSFLFTPAGLPHNQAHLEYHVHFLCTSNIAPPLEMLDGIAEQMQKGQEDGIWAWDCESNEVVLVIPSVLAMLGDNPMQSELSCHIGLHGKYFCRCCFVKGKDGTDDTALAAANSGMPVSAFGTIDDAGSDSATDRSGSNVSTGGGGRSKKQRKAREETAQEMLDRVRRFLRLGTPRSGRETRSKLKSIFTAATTVGQKTLSKNMKTESGIKDMYQEHFTEKVFDFMKKLTGSIPDRQKKVDEFLKTLPREELLTSPIWRLQKDLDPHQDTPVEILHVVLLGFVKYFWRDAMARLTAEEKETVVARLTSIRTEGLGITLIAARTLVKYAGSLVGRDFRIIAQVAPFALYGLLPTACYEAWISLANLMPLIWQPVIDDLDKYLDNLKAGIHVFLLATTKWTPRWFNKPKFHVILHLPDHIRRLGPAILFATEAFESFNSPIRSLSINSNRQAPSRDIAVGFAAANRLRHLLSGGKFVKNWDIYLASRNISLDAVPGSEDADGDQHLAHIIARLPVADIAHARLHDIRHVGTKVMELARDDPEVSEALRFPKTAGERAVPVLERQYITWQATLSSKVLPGDHSDLAKYMYRRCKSCMLPGDGACKDGSYVVANIAIGTGASKSVSPFICQVVEMLYLRGSAAAVDGFPSFALVKVFRILGTSPVYLMPELEPYTVTHENRQSKPHYSLLSFKDLVCLANVQHNCARFNCPITRTRRVRQERENTDIFCDEIDCVKADKFILNTAQMRSARHLAPFRRPFKEPSPIDITRTTEMAVVMEVEARKQRNKSTGNSGKRNPPSGGSGLRTSTLNAAAAALAQARDRGV